LAAAAAAAADILLVKIIVVMCWYGYLIDNIQCIKWKINFFYIYFVRNINMKKICHRRFDPHFLKIVKMWKLSDHYWSGVFCVLCPWNSWICGLKIGPRGGGAVSILRQRSGARTRVLKNAAFFRTRQKMPKNAEKCRKMPKSDFARKRSRFRKKDFLFC
jgi:hypothetical protein